jgi:hypothetical protein
MEALATLGDADGATLLDEEFRALEQALESKRRDDVGRLGDIPAGQDMTLVLTDGRLVRGFFDRCENGKIRLTEGHAYVMDAIREVVQHPKTLWA